MTTLAYLDPNTLVNLDMVSYLVVSPVDKNNSEVLAFDNNGKVAWKSREYTHKKASQVLNDFWKVATGQQAISQRIEVTTSVFNTLVGQCKAIPNDELTDKLIDKSLGISLKIIEQCSSFE